MLVKLEEIGDLAMFLIYKSFILRSSPSIRSIHRDKMIFITNDFPDKKAFSQTKRMEVNVVFPSVDEMSFVTFLNLAKFQVQGYTPT